MTEALAEFAVGSMRGGLATLVRATEEGAGVEEIAGRLSLIFCGEDGERGCGARGGGCDAADGVGSADFGAEWELLFARPAAETVFAVGGCGSTEAAC